MTVSKLKDGYFKVEMTEQEKQEMYSLSPGELESRLASIKSSSVADEVRSAYKVRRWRRRRDR